MKIGVFHNLPPGGALRVAHEQFTRLDGQISSAFFPSGQDCSGLCSSASVYRFATRRTRSLNKPFGRLNGLLAVMELVAMDQAGRKMADAVDGDGCDVFFAHPCRVTQTPTVLKYVKTPSVYYCHEPFRAMHENPIKGGVFFPADDPLRALYSRLAVKQENDAVRAASIVLCNSYYVREYLMRSYGVNALVNYPGVNKDIFHPVSLPKEKMVLSVGRLSPLKGHEFIVESLSLIPSADRPALGIVCGPGNPQQEVARLNAYAESRGVSVTMHEDISDEALVRLYNTATTCAVAPVLEPLGLVALEAMACGTPVVGVAEGGVRETVVDGQTGYLTNRDSEEFAAAVARLIQNPALAREMGMQGRQHVLDRWNWNDSISLLQSHLKKAGGIAP